MIGRTSLSVSQMQTSAAVRECSPVPRGARRQLSWELRPLRHIGECHDDVLLRAQLLVGRGGRPPIARPPFVDRLRASRCLARTTIFPGSSIDDDADVRVVAEPFEQIAVKPGLFGRDDDQMTDHAAPFDRDIRRAVH